MTPFRNAEIDVDDSTRVRMRNLREVEEKT